MMRACLACGSARGAIPLCPGILRCADCGLGFRDGGAPADMLGPLYEENYYSGTEYRDYLEEKASLQKNFRRRIADLSRRKPGGRLFEIGAAYGFFLELARAHWEARGCDLSEAASRYARETLGVDVACGDFTEVAGSGPADYDIICMWDTLEHLMRPDQVVAHAAGLLRPGGLLCLTTGDLDSLSARLQGRRWRLLHAPTHFYFFGRKSVSRLLERCGLRLVDHQYEGYHRSLGQMAYRLLAANKTTRIGRALYDILEKTGILDRDLYLNLYDIMFVVAQKPALTVAPPSANTLGR